MAVTHFGITDYVLQPGSRTIVDENGALTTEFTYIGPQSVQHPFTRGALRAIGSNEMTMSVETENLEGGLCQVRVVTKDLGEMRDIRSVTEEWSRQYFSTVVPGYGYFMGIGRWIMVPAAIVRCTRYSKGGYSRGSLGHGGVSAPSYGVTKKIRVKDTDPNAVSPGKTSEVTVSIAPSAWFCASATCNTTGDLQEIEERWEVEYHISYSVGADYHI